MVYSSFLVLMCTLSLLESPAAIMSSKRPCQDLSSQCLKRSIQWALPLFVEGVPEYGLETLDPYYIDRLNLTLPGGIVVQFRDGRAKGFRKCNVDFAKFHGNTLESQYHCNLTIKGKYKSKGKMLMFPIDGDGDSTIMCYNLRLHSAIKFKTKLGNDGQKYLEIKSFNISHYFDGKVSYSMTNLFRGNPVINRAMVNFMNDNWRMIAEEFGKPLVDYGISCFIRNFKRVLRILPLNQITTVQIDL